MFAALAALIRLRYQLLRGQSRTRLGRGLLLGAGLAVAVGLSLVLGAGRDALGTYILQRSQARSLLEALLTLIAVLYGGLAVLLGVGPRAAFADATLRRYPLARWQRLIARHVVGLLDPLWPLMALNVVGLISGIGARSVLIALPTAVLYVAVIYLLSLVTLVLLDVIVLHPAGSVLLVALLFSVMTVASKAPILFFRLLTGRLPAPWAYSPPAATATLLLPDIGALVRVEAALVLLGWLVVTLVVLTALDWLLDRLPPAGNRAGGFSDRLAHRMASLFGRERAPLVEKSLHYLLRSARIRLGLISSVLYIVYIGPLGERTTAPGSGFAFALFGFFTSALVAAHPVAFNAFAYDGPGVRRYASLPVRFSAVLHSSAAACLLLSGATVGIALAFWTILQRPSAAELTVLTSVSVVALCLAHGLGLWSSLVAPKAAEPGRVSTAPLSAGGNIVFLGLFGLALLVTGWLILSRRADGLADSWPWFVWTALAAVGFLLVMLHTMGARADRLRERLMQSLSDTSSR